MKLGTRPWIDRRGRTSVEGTAHGETGRDGWRSRGLRGTDAVCRGNCSRGGGARHGAGERGAEGQGRGEEEWNGAQCRWRQQQQQQQVAAGLR
jgi:hypothetical protein